MVIRYSRKERRGRLDLRIGSVLNLIQITSVTHVGAHLAEESWEYEHFGLPVTWVEPIPDLVAQIKSTGLPQGQNIVELLLGQAPGLSQTLTLFGPEFSLSSVLELRNSVIDANRLIMTTSILNDLTPTDLLVLDVQGSELNVLIGGGNFLDSCKYVFVEVSLRDIYYKSTPTFEQIEKFLAIKGFVLKLKLMHGHNGLEGNCLFVNQAVLTRRQAAVFRTYQTFRSFLLTYRNRRHKIKTLLKSSKS